MVNVLLTHGQGARGSIMLCVPFRQGLNRRRGGFVILRNDNTTKKAVVVCS